MRPRHPHEPHRATSSLELFFDLVFVIAVGSAASSFHHALTGDHVQHGVVGFIVMFFSIWWAWVNFTWFATSFDCDDWLYRVLTIFQMSGVIVFSTGIPAGFDGDFRIVVAGYVIMRICMATQWFRAGLTNPEYRATAFAAGIELLVDVETGCSHLSERGAALVYFDVLIPFPAVWTTCVLIAIVAILVARNKSVDA